MKWMNEFVEMVAGHDWQQQDWPTIIMRMLMSPLMNCLLMTVAIGRLMQTGDMWYLVAASGYAYITGRMMGWINWP